jgi:RNA polymerase sigma-70 factor (ECF subfamily)
MDRRTPATAPEAADADCWFRDAYPRLHRFAAVVAPPTIDPDDLVQDAMGRLLGRRNPEAIDDRTAYVCRTMANLASDRRRRWKIGRGALAKLGPQPTHAESTYPSDLGVLSELSARERGAVYLHDVEGFPFDEVAQLLGCSTVAARQAAVRGRNRLHDVAEVMS